MAAQNKVTLTFAGDASGLARSAKQAEQAMAGVEAAGRKASAAHGKVNQQALAASRGFRELAASSLLLNNYLPESAQKLSLMAVAGGDLSKAFINLKPQMSSIIERAGLLRIGLIGLGIAAAGVAVEATKNKTGWANLHQDAWKPAAAQLSILDNAIQAVPGHLGFLGSAVDGVTDKFRTNAGWSHTTAGAMADLAAQAQRTAAALAAAHEASLFQAPDTNPGGDAFFTAADAQTIATQVYDQGTPGYAQRAMDESGLWKSAANATAKGISDAARAAKEAAAKAKADMLAAQKSIAQAVRGIMDAFKPQFDLDTGSTDGYSRVGDTRGGAAGGLIANLRKQAADTIKLRRDIDKLAKMGLDKGLLSTLVQGGLASLPAAEDLLHGGKVEVGQANKYAGQINSASNTIASREVARNLSKKDLHTLEVKVTGGDADLVKLVRKWVRNNGGNVQSVLGS